MSFTWNTPATDPAVTSANAIPTPPAGVPLSLLDRLLTLPEPYVGAHRAAFGSEAYAAPVIIARVRAETR